MDYEAFNLGTPKPVLYDQDSDSIVFFYNNLFVVTTPDIFGDDEEYQVSQVWYSIDSLVIRAGFIFFNQDSLAEKKELINRAKHALFEDNRGVLKEQSKIALEDLEYYKSKQDNIRSINECKKANLI